MTEAFCIVNNKRQFAASGLAYRDVFKTFLPFPFYDTCMVVYVKQQLNKFLLDLLFCGY